MTLDLHYVGLKVHFKVVSSCEARVIPVEIYNVMILQK